MFHYIRDFVKAWEYEAGATQKLMDALTDASLSQEIVTGHRTLGRIAWHIVTTIPEMMSLTGLKFSGLDQHAPLPKTAAQVAQAYRAVAKELAELIQSNWNDDTLKIEDDMYGEKWPRRQSLRILIDHQTHHRGQMTVLMRQAGLNVPGVYGPSKEEWANYGGQPPEV
jgi:uncharacterized damage-inducible protein DinB